MSEYTHNDDVADLLYEKEQRITEQNEMILTTVLRLEQEWKRADAMEKSWLASNASLNDAEAEIARLNKACLDAQLYFSKVTYAEKDMEIANLTGLLASTQTKLDRLETELDRLEKEHARGL